MVNGKSVLFTKSSRSLETRPLRAFIMTSICSFIACICEDGRWGCIREGGHARIPPLRSTGLITALLLLKPPSFGAVPLVLLLTVMSRVLLSQLFIQVVILFREAFYCSCEGLNLSF